LYNKSATNRSSGVRLEWQTRAEFRNGELNFHLTSRRFAAEPDSRNILAYFEATLSGVAGPLAAQGGGPICRPFVLGF